MDDRRARAEAIESFAATLRELRNAVGNPPYREMSGRSGAISHTTLHEATKGNRLPSWETTVEFVKACDADPVDYRERWEQANRVVRSASAGESTPRAATSAEQPSDAAARPSGGAELLPDAAERPSDGAVDRLSGGAAHPSDGAGDRLSGGAARPSDGLAAGPGAARLALASQAPPSADDAPPPPPNDAPPSPNDAPPSPDGVPPPPSAPLPAPPLVSSAAPPAGKGRSRPARVAALAAAVVVVAGAVAVVVTVLNNGAATDDPGPAPSGPGSSAAALSPAECPVRSTNPPWAPPLHPGDKAEFIEDVTLPDCARVDAGKTVTKVWRLKNAGTVPWTGYSLRRLDFAQQADQCQTISDVPIKDTPPGGTVDVETVVTTPRKPGLCYVRFKMVDASGAILFPGSRPINFQIIVDAR
ncbi:NBR1-Ig-like domain-containing protein [Nonomuraea bangladeshensis]|uniref:NBR1-Ig-like domain-containing protein n=1 Tax=Nonomuraea bangladeshensis TaxID=404385 RepID=UPI0031D6752C